MAKFKSTVPVYDITVNQGDDYSLQMIVSYLVFPTPTD